MNPTDNFTITYVESPGPDVVRLARLDDTRVPDGPVLVAALDGTPCATVPVDGGPAIADPFRRTADIVALLRLRAAQLRDARRFDGMRPFAA